MRSLKALGVSLLALSMLAPLSVSAAPKSPAKATRAAQSDSKVIIVTMDGMRWQEIFRGPDMSIVEDKQFTPNPDVVRKAFVNVPNPAETLTPFLHKVVAKQGVLAGNRDEKSCVQVTNPHWFSYPGYSEILTGHVDVNMNTNDKVLNPNVTVLEAVNRLPGFQGKVMAFGSWDVFPAIINEDRAGVPVNAGYEPYPDDGKADTKMLNRLMADTPHEWGSERYDSFTHQMALKALKDKKPRLMFVSYGETDEYAHEGHFDKYLTAAQRNDAFIQELWNTLQADPYYRGKTTLIVTTDHGRGYAQRGAWRHHGAKETPEDIAKGQDFGRGSNQTWVGVIGPKVQANVQPQDGQCWGANQVAATALMALGLDAQKILPKAGPAFPAVFKP